MAPQQAAAAGRNTRSPSAVMTDSVAMSMAGRRCGCTQPRGRMTACDAKGTPAGARAKTLGVPVDRVVSSTTVSPAESRSRPPAAAGAHP